MNKRFPFIAAPLLVTAYGLIRIVDGFGGGRGPGLAWTVGHVAFLAALVLFVPVLWKMRQRAGGGRLATVSAVIGLAGAGFAVAQIGIDIVVGVLAADDADMQRMFHDVKGVPGVGPAVYDVGPALFYLGLVVAVVELAARRAVPAWAPVVLLVGVFASAAALDLLPLGGLLMFAALLPLARRGREGHAAAMPARA